MVFEESTNNGVSALPVQAGSKWAEATSFIRDVRSAYIQDPSPNNYERFLSVLREFKLATLPLLECFKLIAALFKSNPHLVPAFNAFAPVGYRLEVRNDKCYVHHEHRTHEVPENIIETYEHIFDPIPHGLMENVEEPQGGFQDENTV